MKIKECVLIEPFICNETETVAQVAKKLRETTLRHIFVIDENNVPKGVISVLDMNNRVIADEKDPKTTLAKDIMSTPVDVYNLEDDAKEVCEKMASKNRVMNPVLNEEGKMVGIITINQAAKALK